MEALLKVSEVAARLRVSVATIRRMVQRGQLPAIKIGKQLRYRESDVAALIASQASVRLRRRWLMHDKVRDDWKVPMKMLVTIPSTAFKNHTAYRADHPLDARIERERTKEGEVVYKIEYTDAEALRASDLITARYILVDAWWQWILKNPERAQKREIEDAYNLCLALHRQVLHHEKHLIHPE
jgi:excisionase family DNA binding protein